GDSRDAYGKYFLTSDKVAKPGEPAVDAEAYYRLARKYGIDPAETITFRPGEHVTVGGQDVKVIGTDASTVIVRPANAPDIPTGERIPVNPEDLTNKYRKIGDSGYYADKEGNYYKLSEDGKELIHDWDVENVNRENVQRKSEATHEDTTPGSDSGRKNASKSGDGDDPLDAVRESHERSPDTVREVADQSLHLSDDSEPASVRRVLDNADITPEERADKLAKIRSLDNKLNNPDVQRALVNDVKDMQASWES